MSESRGEPEPMQILDELVCDAIVPPEVAREYDAAASIGIGVDEGMTILPESITDASRFPMNGQPASPPSPPAPAIVHGIAALIQQMPDPARTVLQLRLEGKSITEIAGKLGVKELEVEHRIRDGVITLRGLFYDYQRRLLAG